MSMIRAKNVAHPSATTSAITLNADGSMSGSFPYPNRNVFKNGSFLVWQRATASTNVTLNGPGYTTADRFWSYQNGTVGVTTARVTAGLTGFPYAIRWGRPIGNSTTGITVLGQTLETIDSLRLAGQTVTLSFYAKKGTDFTASSSNVGVKLYTGKGTDQSTTTMVTGSWTSSATPIDSVATLTTSWQRFTYTAALPSDITQIGLYLNWTPTGTAGPDDNVYLTGVQLEAGSVATDFEFKSFGQELLDCQRYCQLIHSAAGKASSSSQVQFAIQFMTEMRTQISLATMSSARITDVTTADFTNSNPGIVLQNPGSRGARIVINNWSGLSSGTMYLLLANDTGAAPIVVSAEL